LRAHTHEKSMSTIPVRQSYVWLWQQVHFLRTNRHQDRPGRFYHYPISHENEPSDYAMPLNAILNKYNVFIIPITIDMISIYSTYSRSLRQGTL
jgi:hypothetical protein